MKMRALAAVLLGGSVLAAPAVAHAHVSVNPREAPQGSFAVLTFRVPNERDDAATTRVEVNLPEAVAIPNVSVKPVPGWTAELERRTLDEPIAREDGDITEVVSRITWSGGEIRPGEFQEFAVSVGPLPADVERLAFPTIQTYAAGEPGEEVVRWIDEAAPGAGEPDHPVPALTLTPAASGEQPTTPTTASGAGAPAPASDDPEDEEDDDARGLALAALVVAIIGVALGGVALLRRRAA
jgi:uncharacterized protein YcnI